MDAEDQRVTLPSASDEADIQARISSVEALVRERFGQESLKGFISDLDALQALLDDGVTGKTETFRLQSLGLVLGQVFEKILGLHWVMVEDQCGRDPALRFKETSIIVFPLTMISKRVERRERFNCHGALNGLRDKVEELLKGGF